jgi:hypothetical protein
MHDCLEFENYKSYACFVVQCNGIVKPLRVPLFTKEDHHLGPDGKISSFGGRRGSCRGICWSKMKRALVWEIVEHADFYRLGPRDNSEAKPFGSKTQNDTQHPRLLIPHPPSVGSRFAASGSTPSKSSTPTLDVATLLRRPLGSGGLG